MKYSLYLALPVLLLAGCSETNNYYTSVQAPNPTSEVRYEFEEKISGEATVVTVKGKRHGDDEGMFEERSEGNPDFDQSLSSLSYEHSFVGIEPPILPEAVIRRARLHLDFEGHLDDFLLVTIDSVEIDRPWKKITVVPHVHGSLTVVAETVLADGHLQVHIESTDGSLFQLEKSKLKIEYLVREPS